METFSLLEQTVQTNIDINVYLHHMDLYDFDYIQLLVNGKLPHCIESNQARSRSTSLVVRRTLQHMSTTQPWMCWAHPGDLTGAYRLWTWLEDTDIVSFCSFSSWLLYTCSKLESESGVDSLGFSVFMLNSLSVAIASPSFMQFLISQFLCDQTVFPPYSCMRAPQSKKGIRQNDMIY